MVISDFLYIFALEKLDTMRKSTETTTSDIMLMLDAMSVEELKNRLAAYMVAEMQLAKKPVGIEVRMSDTPDRGGRYDVLLITADGEELEVMFTDRPSRLIYIYTLMHPEGFQRRSLQANNYRKLAELYSKLYFVSAEPMLKSIEKLGFDQYINQAVTQSRVALRKTIGKSEEFEIARPQRNGGRTLVTFAANGGNVIIDNSLL